MRYNMPANERVTLLVDGAMLMANITTRFNTMKRRRDSDI